VLTDFVVSAHLTEGTSAAGTPLFMVPEAFRGEVSAKLDL